MQNILKNNIEYPFFTWENFFRLAGIREDHCVSIFIPTRREGSEEEVKEGKNRLRKELNYAHELLAKTDLSSEEINRMLAPANGMLENSELWRNQSDGLAIFIRKSGTRHFALPLHFEQQTALADRFLLKPILPFFNHDGRFYLMMLSPEMVRLYECSRHAVTEIDIADLVPESLEQMKQKNAAANLSLKQFLTAVNDGIRELLIEDDIPVVLACPDEINALYSTVSSYPKIFKLHISGNPTDEPILMLHERAWALIGDYFKREMEKERDNLRANSRLTVTGIRDVLPLAVHGKIETLFIRKGYEVWGSRENDIVELSLQASKAQSDIPLVNEAALQTFFQGGKVYLLPDSDLPIPGQPVSARMNGSDQTTLYMDTLLTSINELESRGFAAQFYIEGSRIKVSGSDTTYLPAQLKIVENHRFEGMSNPSDSSQLFALVAEDGLKGTLVVSFGAKSSQNLKVLHELESLRRPVPH